MEIEHKIEKVCKLCNLVAYAAIVVMMLLTASDVIARAFMKPIPGVYDLVCVIQVILVALAIPYCAFQRGHIRVDMIMNLLPMRVQRVIDSVIGLLSLGFFIVVTWECFVLANDMRKAGEVSMSAFIPHYPFIYIIVFSCALLCIVLLSEVIRSIAEVKR
jgi:TRAP-type C4-dicarboxylate transport system permease small subunit